MSVIVNPFLNFVLGSWWLWAFIVLLPVARSTWLFYRQRVYENIGTKFVLTEMKIPRIIEKSPRAMDQVLASIGALANAAGDLQELYWDGEVTRWYSFEIISFGGEIHFYVRMHRKLRPLVEAAFFAFYPEVELVDCEDYAHTRLPHSYADLEAAGYDTWGTELMLAKNAAYPIRSYTEFENIQEMHQLDPVSAFLEVLGRIKKEEFVGVQFVAAPKSRLFWAPFEHIVEDLRKPKRIKAAEVMEDATGSGEITVSVPRSPGQTDVLKAIEQNFSKVPYEVVPRYLYISPKNLYYDTFARRGILGAFNQYADTNMNYFLRNDSMGTKVKIWDFPYIFPTVRRRMRQQRLYKYFQHRELATHTFMGRLLNSHPFNWGWHSKPILLSSESLATLWHPPSGLTLTAPHTPRMESRKMAAPAGLQIYGDEKELDRFRT